MRFNRVKFYEGMRQFERGLTQGQVNGINYILDSMEKDPFLKKVEHAAYMFATIKPETAHTYQPIHEYGGHKYFVKRYGSQTKVGKRLGNDTPEEGATYAGRGNVQLTGESNYEKAEEALRKYYPEIVAEFEARTGKKFDLTVGDQLNDAGDADIASDPAIAYAIMSFGMRTGMFTGRKLSDFDFNDPKDVRNARKIINGLDHADMIRGYYNRFLPILKQSLILGASTTTADTTATDSNSPIDEPQDTSPPTNIETTTVDVDGGTVTSTTTTTQEEAEIEGVRPYNDVGLSGSLKNDAKAILPANIGLSTVSEWIQQTTGWPEWVSALIPKLVIIALVCTALWLVYRVLMWLMWNWRENERVKLLALINSDKTRKDIVLK